MAITESPVSDRSLFLIDIEPFSEGLEDYSFLAGVTDEQFERASLELAQWLSRMRSVKSETQGVDLIVAIKEYLGLDTTYGTTILFNAIHEVLGMTGYIDSSLLMSKLKERRDVWLAQQ